MKNKTNPSSPLTGLKERIEKAKGNFPPRHSASLMSRSFGKTFNVGVELVAGVLAGVAGGLFIDWIFGTSPWGLVILFILGAGAGFLNVYRTLTKKL